MTGGVLNRREFLRQSSCLGLALVLPVFPDQPVLRPPGARRDFLARCIRCGKCLEACPFDSIRFLGISAGGLVHTPYIDPLKTPCYLCQKRGTDGKDHPVSRYLRCGEACPTGALTMKLAFRPGGAGGHPIAVSIPHQQGGRP